MPYLPAAKRRDVDSLGPSTGAELCYAVTKLCEQYLSIRVEGYAVYGDVRHALATAWDVIAPRLQTYEVRKQLENGPLV